MGREVKSRKGRVVAQLKIVGMIWLQMKTLVESLSIGSAAILIAVLSVGVVWLLCTFLPVALRWLCVVIVPSIFAYSLYRLPVWLGDDASEYSAWAVLLVGAWFIAGAVPSAGLVLILRERRAR
jgi:hypothetical protein